MSKKYVIAYLTLNGRTFTYRVDSYEIVNGDFVQFIDPKTKEVKRLHSSRCEITEVDDD